MAVLNNLAVALAISGAVSAVPAPAAGLLQDFENFFSSLTAQGLPGFAFGGTSTAKGAPPGYGGDASTSSEASSATLPGGYGGVSTSIVTVTPVPSSSASSVSKAAPSGSSPSGFVSGTGSTKSAPLTTSKSFALSSPSSSSVAAGPSSVKPSSSSVPVGTGSSKSSSSVAPSGPSSSSVAAGTGSSKSSTSKPAGTAVPPSYTKKTTLTSKPAGTAVPPPYTKKTSLSTKKTSLSTKKTSVPVTAPLSTSNPVGTVVPSGSKPASSGATSKVASSGVSSKSVLSKTASASGTGSTPQPSVGVNSTVSTTSGKVAGHIAPNTTEVLEYLGIPFAQPAVGDLRFAPPVAYTSNDFINGSTYGFDCPCVHLSVPQALGPRLYTLLGDLAQVNDTLGESCLNINIWNKPSSNLKPTLVWIYGGGFNFGGINSAVYDGRYFADEEDVVFVAFNYRTNVMGFSGSPSATQNVGLLDQRLALEWIRDNIAQFGGDASRITIFGQSAGGASVDLYTFAYADDPIIAGAIPMSGSANSFGDRDATAALASWDNVTTTLGCGNSTNTANDTVLACMRSPTITWEAIQSAAAPDPGLRSLLGKFGPVIDEATVFSNYTDLALNGKFAQVPYLTGNTNDESGLFVLISAGAGESYPDSTYEYINTQVFTCPVSRIARYRSQGGVPVWRYYYSAAYPSTILPTANLTQAWHTSELPLLFGTVEEVTLTASETNQTLFGNYIRHAWATFAHNPTSGLIDEFGWEEYSSGNYVALGQNNETTAAYAPLSDIEGPCAF